MKQVVYSLVVYEDGKVVFVKDGIKYQFANMQFFEQARKKPHRMDEMSAEVFDLKTGKYLKHRGMGVDAANEILEFAGVVK